MRGLDESACHDIDYPAAWCPPLCCGDASLSRFRLSVSLNRPIGSPEDRRCSRSYSLQIRKVLMRTTWIGPLVVALVASVASLGAQEAERPASLEELESAARRDSLDPETLYRLALRYDLVSAMTTPRAWRGRWWRSIRATPPPGCSWVTPYDRRPKLWAEVARESAAGATRSRSQNGCSTARSSSTRWWTSASTGAPPLKQDMIIIREYGQYTTDYLLDLAMSAFGWRYELCYNAADLYVQRQFENQPVDSIPSGLFWIRGLAAAHLNSYTRAIADIQVLLDRSLKHEASDSLI
jgi:hypothetical protein